MSTPARKPALSLTKAPVREHPVAPVEPPAELAAASPPSVAPRRSQKTPAAQEPAKSRGMGTVTFRVDLDLHHEAKRYAFDHDMTVQAVLGDALREYLKRHAS